MVTCTLIAQGTLDQDEIRCGSYSADLARRRDADEQPASGNEQLFGYEHREGRTHSAAYDAHLAGTIEVEGEKVGMVAGPPLMGSGCSGTLEMAHNVAIGIEDADSRDSGERQPFLPACLA